LSQFPESDTLAFYELNAEAYARQTAKADLSNLYDRFLPLVMQGGRILDVGCGGGRDLRAFKERGFECVGVDASPRLAKIAHEYSDCRVVVGKIEELRLTRSFDAAWACASLLHVRRSRLPAALHRIRDALRPSGIFFVSVQEGNGEHVGPDGRLFIWYSCEDLIELVKSSGFVVFEQWRTEDKLPGRIGKTWINLLARCNLGEPHL